MTDASSQAARDAEEAKPRTSGDPPHKSMTPVEAIMARMDAHDTEGEAIDAELAKLKLTKKNINSIRSTKARIAKEEAMLAQLTGRRPSLASRLPMAVGGSPNWSRAALVAALFRFPRPHNAKRPGADLGVLGRFFSFPQKGSVILGPLLGP